MQDPMQLQYTVINGRKIIGRRFFLEALAKAHEEIVAAGIGVAGHLGFLLSGEETGSWRSEAMQRQLLNRGASKTMESNHRRGVAVDCFPDREYIAKIKPFMNKYKLVNDLAPWDAVHWQYISNAHAWSYKIINQLPVILNQFSMNELEGKIIQLIAPGTPGSGGFAYIQDGKKRVVRKDRAGEFAAGMLVRLLSGEHLEAQPVTLQEWNDIPDGENF